MVNSVRLEPAALLGRRPACASLQPGPSLHMMYAERRELFAFCKYTVIEPEHSISYKIACSFSEGSDEPAPPHSLIRVFAGHSRDSQRCKTSSGGQRRLIIQRRYAG